MQQKVISIVVLAALGIAVGCGDGTRHKASVNRGLLGNKNALNNKAGTKVDPTKLGGTTPSTSTPSTTPKSTTTSTSDADAKQKQIESAIDADMKAGKALNSTSDLAAGTYTIDSIESYYRRIINTGNSGVDEEIKLVGQGSDYNFQIGSNPVSFGTMVNEVDAGRQLKFPTTFTISKDAPFKAVDGTYPTLVFSAVAGADTTSISFKNTLSKDADANAVDLAQAMNVVSKTTADGKALATAITALPDGSLRVKVNVEEAQIDQSPGAAAAKTAAVYRDYIVTYKFTAAAPSDASATPAATTSTDSAAAPAAADAATPSTTTSN